MEQTQFTRDTVRRASQLPQTQQLLELLRADGGAALEQAAARLRAGAAQDALAQLQPMLDTPEAQALLRQLGEALG